LIFLNTTQNNRKRDPDVGNTWIALSSRPW